MDGGRRRRGARRRRVVPGIMGGYTDVGINLTVGSRDIPAPRVSGMLHSLATECIPLRLSPLPGHGSYHSRNGGVRFR